MAKKSAKKDVRPSDYTGYTIEVKEMRSRKNPKVLILRASGKFSSHESWNCGRILSDNLNEKLVSERVRDRKNIVLSLSGITALDSVGVGVLAIFIGKCLESGVKLVWCSARQRVRDKLTTTTLIYLIPYYNTEEEALNSFGK